jgi:hypothetical protein
MGGLGIAEVCLEWFGFVSGIDKWSLMKPERNLHGMPRKW